MHKIIKTATFTLLAGMLIISPAGCASSTGTAKKAITVQREVAVQKGSMSTTVSVDGNLVMPEASSLAFGSSGNVKDVLVKEGDRVKAGAIMATLEDTTQVLDIKSSNISVQNVLANLYEKVPRLPQFPGNVWDATVTAKTTTTTTTTWALDTTSIDPSTGLPFAYPVYVPTTTTTTTPVYGYIGRIAVDPADPDPLHPTMFITVYTYDPLTVTTFTAPEGEVITPVYTGYYPNATSLNSFNWAVSEISNSYSYLLTENYTATSSELTISVADLEATVMIIEDTINNPESGLGNTAPVVNEENVTYMNIMGQDPAGAGFYIQTLRGLVKEIRSAQADMESLKALINQNKYSEAAPLYEALFTKINDLGKSIITNYNIIQVRNDTKIYGEDICLKLYAAADEKLNAALKGIETGGLNSQELDDNLRIARHYMELCNGILGTNDYVLQHGLSLKAEQGYKIDLAKAMVDLGNKRDDFLKTVIMSPFDGIVVSVGVKDNDVLSNMDYSSKTIQVVDTTQIKFTGTVDEIDILKIKNGQKATVSIDAISDKTFPGHVSFISPYGTTSGSVVKFNITVLLDPTDVDLKGGLTASADVAISGVDDALILPLSAVTTDKDGSYVNVKNSTTGLQEKKKVTTGIQNTQYIQIVSGLSEGEKVIVEDKATGAPVSTTMGPPGGGGGGPPPGR